MGEPALKRLEKLYNPQEIKSYQIRVAQYGKVLEILESHPFFGVGLANYRKNTIEASFMGMKSDTYTRSAHNTYLNIIGERGLVGFMAWLSVFIFGIKRIFLDNKLYKHLTDVDIALIVCCVSTFFSAFFLDLGGVIGTMLIICLPNAIALNYLELYRTANGVNHVILPRGVPANH